VDIPQSFRDEAFKLAQLVARVQVDPETRNKFAEQLKSARTALQKAEAVAQQILGKLPLTPEHAEILAALEISKEELSADDVRAQMLAREGRFNERTVEVYTPLAELIRNWILERVDKSPFLTDCTLRHQVPKVELPRLGEQISIAYATSFANTRELADLVINYVRDCVCRALNPACEPCDDSAVLLACFEVEECNVIKICNFERRFVLSPAALRYWLPPVQLVGNVLEGLCCMPLERLIKDDSDFFKKLVLNEVLRLLRASPCVKDDNDAKKLINVFSQLFDYSESPPGSKAPANLLTTPSAESVATVEGTRDLGTSSEPMDAMLAQLDARIEEMTEKKVQEILAREPRVAAPTERRAPRRQTKKPPEPKTDPSGGDQQ